MNSPNTLQAERGAADYMDILKKAGAVWETSTNQLCSWGTSKVTRIINI
jgi:hypothetical protein